jgi:hypothetical protein
MKYSDHNVADTVKFLDLVQHNYMECKERAHQGAPLEPV